MCGIFGLVKNENSDISDIDTLEVINKLFIFSQTRGSEAAGIAINTGRSIDIYKKAGSPREFVNSLEYKNLFKNSIETYIENKKNSTFTDSLSIIGHSRLVTNGIPKIRRSDGLGLGEWGEGGSSSISSSSSGSS